MMQIQIDLTEDAADLISVMLRRFATTNTEWFFEDFALESDYYPDEVHDIILGLCDILDSQEEENAEEAERQLASIGIAILSLYDLTRPERATTLTLEQDMIARVLIDQVEENTFSFAEGEKAF